MDNKNEKKYTMESTFLFQYRIQLICKQTMCTRGFTKIVKTWSFKDNTLQDIQLQDSLDNFALFSENCIVAIRLFHIHTKLAIMVLMPTLYSNIFAVFFIICILRC